jgi:hypothetical protein
MLRNLKEIYQTQRDWQRLLAVQERLVVLLPESWSEFRDRGFPSSTVNSGFRHFRPQPLYINQSLT